MRPFGGLIWLIKDANKNKIYYDNILEPIKTRIIIILDNFDKYCWMDLVLWSMGTRGWEDVGLIKYNQPCNYCGKCKI